MCVILFMVYLDYPVDKTIGESYSYRKYIFAQDLWHAQNPKNVLSNLPLNVQQMLQRYYILKRPLNLMWAFLRLTIGLPIELVIKIMVHPSKEWKIFVPRPLIDISGQVDEHFGAYRRYERNSGLRSNVN